MIKNMKSRRKSLKSWGRVLKLLTESVPVTIQYRVTGTFGSSKVGDTLSALLLIQDKDSGSGLVFHPPCKKELTCGSLEFCEQGPDDVWVPIVAKDENYVNLPTSSKEYDRPKNSS